MPLLCQEDTQRIQRLRLFWLRKTSHQWALSATPALLTYAEQENHLTGFTVGEVRSEKVLGDSLRGMAFFEGGSAPSCGFPEHELELWRKNHYSELALALARGILNWAEVCSEVCISNPTAIATKWGGMRRAKKRNPFAWLKIIGNWKARISLTCQLTKNSSNNKKQQKKLFLSIR